MKTNGHRYAWQVSVAIAACVGATLPATAQLNQNCTVSVLNRTVSVNPDGSWVLPNIPANFGQVKARATCTQNGVTTFGESDFFIVPANAAINLPAITMGNVTPIPTSLSLPVVSNLTAVGQVAQLTVTATYPDGSTKDVTPSASGTNYTISNPAIATISADGLVTAVSSGTVVIQANNDGATGIVTAMVVIGGQSVGGIPVSWLLQYHLNPNDPLVALEDPDRDGLTNLQEYQIGTDPTNPDTDGDGLTDGAEVNVYHTNPLLADTDGDKIPDGVEVQTGTNPLDPNSYDLKKATAVSTVTPPSFILTTSIANPAPSVQLNWKVQLIDGKTTLDLTADPRTRYASSNLSVCSFGQQSGLIFAGAAGSCTITISQNKLSLPVAGTVSSFTPTEVSTINVPGAVAVDVAGTFAYVATGTNGMSIVDVNDRTNPHVRGILEGLGDAEGIRAVGLYVYIADTSSGLRIVNTQNPDAPVLVSSLPLAGKPVALEVHGNLAAVAAGSGGVSLVNITDPTNPILVATISLPAPALGVDFDPQSGLAAIAMGTAGLQLADISNPSTPRLRGLLAGGDVRRVLLKLPAALLADALRSITSVDVSNPDQPSVSLSLAANLGGVPVDIAAYGNIAMTADISFGRAAPIVNISAPLQPISDGFWTLLSPGYSSSIAVDLAFGYLVVPATSTLRILQYQRIVDTFGIPPTVSITAPSAGATLIQGQSITFAASAADDVAVASVNFLVDGQAVFSTAAQPYQFQYTVPGTATMLILSATATDYGNNVGIAQNVSVNVIPDPLTTVTGRVVDGNGNPVSGATINVPTFQGSPTTTTAADGTYSLAGVSTISGNVQVLAEIVNPSGATLAGYSASVAPVRGGTTNAGTITVIPIPIISAMSAKSMLEGTQLTLTVTGSTLQGATWAFQPVASSAGIVQVLSTASNGSSATLLITAPNGMVGTFALVATNAAGNSGTVTNRINRLTIVDPNSTADADGDGYQDVIEAVYGTDPLDAASYPIIRTQTETQSIDFSVLNAPVSGGLTETESVAFSVLNSPSMTSGVSEVESVPFSALNAPIGSAGITEVDAYFTVCNQLNYSGCPTPSLAHSQTASRTEQANSSGTAAAPAQAAVVDPLADSDGDGLPDWFEMLTGTDPQKADTDGDGLNDFDEMFVYHTSPLEMDTDGDGFSDSDEVMFGSDPLNSADTPLRASPKLFSRDKNKSKSLQGDQYGRKNSEERPKTQSVSGSVGGALDIRRPATAK